ncbi:MAG: orotidine-5'-phosphate decarboxylase [Candidatus Yanofskybacteria bacterium]|nr:orotidine-5'-phosphate decarboxylase [Candidatus Yanofskybacteria bacterium]
MSRNFRELLEAQWARGNFVCVGLDSEFGKIPESARISGNECEVSVANTVVAFNRAIVEATKDLVCAYKPNAAFYEAYGDEGIGALQRTIADIHAIAPDVPVILDAKRADIGNTNAGYVDAAFGFLRADAVTVHPYLGAEALQPFLARAEKGVIVLCRTSNPGAGEFQDLNVGVTMEEVRDLAILHVVPTSIGTGGITTSMSNHIAYQVSRYWNKNGNCALVVGATYPHELQGIRAIVGDMPILIPGIGAQGGDVEKTVSAGKDSRGWGMIINASRGIIFASKGADFAEAARRETEKLRDLINQYRLDSPKPLA